MKNQRTKTRRSFHVSVLLTVMTMVALLIGCFAVTASAETVAITVDPGVNLDLSASNVSNVGGVYTKEYDGTSKASGILVKRDSVLSGVAEGDNVYLLVDKAYFTDAAGNKVVNAGEATTLCIEFYLRGIHASKYSVEKIELPAAIAKQTLYWDGAGTATAPYQPESNLYNDLPVTAPAIVDANGRVVTAVKLVGADGLKVSVQSIDAADVTTQIPVSIEAADASVLLSNYTILPMPVEVDIVPLGITEVTLSANTFVYDPTKLPDIKATAFVNGYECELIVVFPEGFKGEVGVHTVTVKSLNPGYAFSVQNELQIEITPKNYQVGMDSQTVVDKTTGPYYLNVKGLSEELPKEILTQIVYTYTKDNVESKKAMECGVYTVVADLSAIPNYTFTDANGAKIDKLTATLKVNPVHLQVGTKELPALVVITGANGADVSMAATVKIPESLSRKGIRGFHAYKAYEIVMTGGSGSAHTLLIGIDESLYGQNLFPMTAADLYLYNPETGLSSKVTDTTGFKVTVMDGYVQIEGVTEGTYTFILAPVYDVPFWLSAPGIALIVLMILALIVLMFFIGIYLHRVQSEANQVLVVDTVGSVPRVAIRPVPEKVNVDKKLEENVEELEKALDKAVKKEEESKTVDVSAETAEAVAQTKEELAEEASQIEADEKSEPEEATNEDEMAISAEELTEAVAEEVAEELRETTPKAEEPMPEPDEERVRLAVAEAMAENFKDNEEAVESDELNAETLRRVVDVIVDDAMHATMLLPNVEETEKTDTAETDAAEEPEVCAIIADSVAVAFEKFTVDGVAPTVLDGTTADIISAAVIVAAKNHIPKSWSEELSDTIISAVTEELIARMIKDEPEVDQTAEAVAEETAEVADEPAKEAEETVAVQAAEEAVEKNEEAVEETAAEDDAAVATMASASEASEDDEDDDNDTDNDDDEEETESDDSFLGFGAMPQSFVDAVADAEAYNDLLAQEKRGEIRIVTRYRRSFMSRLVQSQGNVQNYYSILKNALMTHKGVKSRLSWNYEAFNKGRAHLVKMNAKTKTLYLYLALDPEELKDTKYGIIDVSSKKKYATVPVLMKIKGDRKFKYALELINKLCEEKMGLPKLDVPEVDYRVDYKTTEELVEAGYIKKLVAGIPTVEEPDVTMVAPTEEALPADAEAAPAEESTEA